MAGEKYSVKKQRGSGNFIKRKEMEIEEEKQNRIVRRQNEFDERRRMNKDYNDFVRGVKGPKDPKKRFDEDMMKSPFHFYVLANRDKGLEYHQHKDEWNKLDTEKQSDYLLPYEFQKFLYKKGFLDQERFLG